MTDAPEDNLPLREDATKIPQFSEIAPALEFISWVFVALCPLMRWANGPPVTDDQANIQIGLATLSVLSAISLRIHNWFVVRRRAGRQDRSDGPR
jgi:hypothetical protein